MVRETKLYDSLSISPNSTQDEVKKAYWKAALKWHPDENKDDPNAAEKFKELAQAYEILSDPTARITYDQYGLQFFFRGGVPSSESCPDGGLSGGPGCTSGGFEGSGGIPGRRVTSPTSQVTSSVTTDIPNDKNWETHLRVYTITTDRPPCLYCADRQIQPDSNTLQHHIATHHTGIEITWTTFSSTHPLPCLFHLLSRCEISFPVTEYSNWCAHYISHFGSKGPPSLVGCIFCKATFTQEDPYSCTNQFLAHIFDHFRNGSKIEQSKPSFTMLRYMHEENLLSEEDYAHYIKYSERLYVDGLHEHDYVPEEIRKKMEKMRRSDNEFIVNDRHERSKIAARRRRRQQKEIPVVVVNPT